MASNVPGTTATATKSKHLDFDQIKELFADSTSILKKERLVKLWIESCRDGCEDIVEFLLTSGIDVDGIDDVKLGKTGLMYACEKSHEKVVDLLLQHGANIDLQDRLKRNALMHLCINGASNENILKLLLKYGANESAIIDAKTHKGVTVLMIACWNGEENIVELLLKYGADVGVRDNCGKTALLSFYLSQNVRIIELLLQHGADVNVTDEQQKTALIYACINHHDETVVQFLLQHGANIDVIDKEGRSAIMWAALRNDTECLRTLLDAGANLDTISVEGHTVFSFAMTGNGDCLRVLLNSGKFWNSEGDLIPDLSQYSGSNSFGALLVTIELGIFEVEWCKKELKRLPLHAMKSGFCPSMFNSYSDVSPSSPLIWSLLDGAFLAAETFLSHLYYFPEDYKTLSTDNSIRAIIKNQALLDEIVQTPLSLETWSLLHVSKAISLTGPPRRRPQRVDFLPIPDKLKRRLKFQMPS